MKFRVHLHCWVYWVWHSCSSLHSSSAAVVQVSSCRVLHCSPCTVPHTRSVTT